MQLTLSARSVVASVSLVGLGMLASPWRATAPQDPRSLDARLRALEAVLTPENGVKLMKMLPHMRVVEAGNLDGSTMTTIVFDEVNVQITNGLGATNGAPNAPDSIDPTVTKVNGLGNLIIGYNELRTLPPPTDFDRAGSHNIIAGINHTYSSFGGLVVGQQNTISGVYSPVSGGRDNTASGAYSSVSGGVGNTASGFSSSVSGGFANTAGGFSSSVSGGVGNTASGSSSSVSGGASNTASGAESSVSGGRGNLAGISSSVSGGAGNTASGADSSVSGGLFNTASGRESSVSGGSNNTASGRDSSVSGGGGFAVGVGSLGNTANGDHSSVGGGQGNNAGGQGSTIIGGCGKTATMPCEVQ